MSSIPLSDVSTPGPFRCVQVDCDGETMIRLKRLGICAGRAIEVLQPGDPMVLRVVGSRLGISRHLSASIVVEATPVAASASSPSELAESV